MLRGERRPTATWTEHDSLLAMALTVYESALCSGCGHPIADTTGEDNDGEWQAEEFRCHACTASLALAERLSEDKNLKHLQAMRYATKRRDPNEVTFWQKPGRRGPSQ